MKFTAKFQYEEDIKLFKDEEENQEKKEQKIKRETQ
jgi:hypothetical protein